MLATLPAETVSSQSLQAFRGVGYWPNRVRAFSGCYHHPGVSSSSCTACVAGAFLEVERASLVENRVSVSVGFQLQSWLRNWD
jgi:hypothetical protein